MIRLFVGLGNPGTEYEATRHNAGFWWVDALAARLKVALQPERGWQGLAARANTPQGLVWLLQPMTYMNRSGVSVAALARFYKLRPEETLVVHDELDLPPGAVKLKLGGSAAGHNGLKDILGQWGEAEFWRLRLGIGHPGVKAEVASYVLKKPSADDRAAIDTAVHKSLAAVGLMLAGDMPKALAQVHAQPPRPKPPRPEPRPSAAPAHAPTAAEAVAAPAIPPGDTAP